MRVVPLFINKSSDLLSDPDELTPRPGKDERFDEVVEEIETLEKELDKELLKFEKSLGLV